MQEDCAPGHAVAGQQSDGGRDGGGARRGGRAHDDGWEAGGQQLWARRQWQANWAEIASWQRCLHSLHRQMGNNGPERPDKMEGDSPSKCKQPQLLGGDQLGEEHPGLLHHLRLLLRVSLESPPAAA